MTRNYELTFIVDPRTSEEDAVKLTDDYKTMITDAGGTVVRQESWGKRRLAYPINKLNEGRYVLLYVESEDGNPMREVEHRMNQNDKVLRYLTVRTDQPVSALDDAEAAEDTSGEEE